MSDIEAYLSDKGALQVALFWKFHNYCLSARKDIQIIINYGILMFKLGKKHFLGFGLNKDSFSLYLVDFPLLDEIKAKLIHSTSTKSSVNLKEKYFNEFDLILPEISLLLNKYH